MTEIVNNNHMIEREKQSRQEKYRTTINEYKRKESKTFTPEVLHTKYILYS